MPSLFLEVRTLSVKQDGAYPRTAADLERRYAFGQTFAEVYSLIEDAQKAANDANNAVNALDSKEIFNRLTSYGKMQGVFRDEADHIYINASYIKGEILEGDDLKVAAANITGKLTATQIDATNLKVNAANITGTLTAGQIDTTFLTVSAANITGVLSADQIDTDRLYVDAANVSGYLSAENIEVAGELTVYGVDSRGRYYYGGEIGYVESDGPDGATSGVGVSAYGNAMVVTDGGAKLVSPTCEILAATHIWLTTDNNIYASTSISTTSDRRSKDEIQHNVDDYLAVFDALKPATFVWLNRKDKRRHLGMIAQEVEEAMLNAGFEASEFAPLNISEDGTYGLAYEEFVPLLIAKVQQLDAEVKELRQNG